jgi:Zn-dependent protease with chaperone function
LDSDADASQARPGFWDGPALFFDGKEAKARPVSVVIGPEGLQILDGEALGAAGVFGPKDMRLLEKHGAGFLQLEFLSLPGAMLEIHDGHALRWIENLKSGGRTSLMGMSLAGKAGVLVAILALVVAFMYYVGLDMAVNGAMAVIPSKADRMLGDAVVAAFDDKTLVPQDSLAVRALKRSVEAVLAMGVNPSDSVRILIVADTSVKNAFAFPGGTLLVYTGMLRLLDDQEEWFGLLAHETGHVHLRHGMHGIVRGSILGIGMSLLFGDVSGLSAVIMDNAGTLLRLKYGRDDEAAADAFASRRMAALGYGPGGLARLFRKFLELEKQPKWAAFLSTHPATEDRIAKLTASARIPARNPGTPAVPKPFALSPEEWAALIRL